MSELVLCKITKEPGEKLRGSGCLALSSPPRLGSTSTLPVLSMPLAMGWSSQRGHWHKAGPDAWGCAALLTTDWRFQIYRKRTNNS